MDDFGDRFRVVVVTGSRKLTDYPRVWRELDELRPSLVVHGGCYVGVRPRVCSGADYWAHRWCAQTDTDERIYRARWALEGRSAGPKRNQRMLEACLPFQDAIVLAFPEGGPGTADCMRRARRLNMPVRVFRGQVNP